MRTALSLAVVLAVVLAACGRSSAPAPLAPIANRPPASTLAAPAASNRLPGSVGLAVDRVAVAGACATHDVRVRVVAAGDDPLFVAALTIAPAADGEQELRSWMKAWSRRIREAQTQATTVAMDERAPLRGRVEALARLVQLFEIGADQLVATPAPATLDATTHRIYCDSLGDVADVMRDQADSTRDLCRRLAGKLAITDGWWVAVCAAPTSP